SASMSSSPARQACCGRCSPLRPRWLPGTGAVPGRYGSSPLRTHSRWTKARWPACAGPGPARPSRANSSGGARRRGVAPAGSTGGTVATARLRLRSLPGVMRPGLAVVLPTRPTPTLLVDAGAIADPKPEMLVAFAQLGVAYAQVGHGITEPKVGLLTI